MAAEFTVETGSGVTGANAYCTTAEADQYHENYGNPTAWSDLSDAQKELAVRYATQALDALFRWRGVRAHSTQGLDWPRAGITDPDGFQISSDSVPDEVKDACAILALESVTETLVPDQVSPGTVKRKKVKAGSVEQDITYIGGLSPEKQYTLVEGILRDLVRSTTLVERS